MNALTKEDYAYGLLLVEAEVATFGMLGPGGVTLLEEAYSIVPKKQRKGGQSSVRYDRVRENLLNDFFKTTSEKAKTVFKHKDYRGTLVGGPGPTKEDFLRKFPQSQVIGVLDVGDSGEPGLRELVNRGAELLKDDTLTKEKGILQEFFGRLAKGDPKTIYGKAQVKEAIENKRLSQVIVGESEEQVEGAIRVSETTEEGRMFAGMGGWGGYLKWA